MVARRVPSAIARVARRPWHARVVYVRPAVRTHVALGALGAPLFPARLRLLVEARTLLLALHLAPLLDLGREGFALNVVGAYP